MIVYFIFLCLSLIWLSILFLGPYLLSLGDKYSFITEVYYLLFSLICHQKPERSYFIWEYQMPVCARCFGIYLGILLGTLIYPFFRKFSNTKIPKFKYIWIFITPILIDGIAQFLHLYPSPNHIRLITGILASGGMVFYILPLLNQLYVRLKDKIS